MWKEILKIEDESEYKEAENFANNIAREFNVGSIIESMESLGFDFSKSGVQRISAGKDVFGSGSVLLSAEYDFTDDDEGFGDDTRGTLMLDFSLNMSKMKNNVAVDMDTLYPTLYVTLQNDGKISVDVE